MCALKIGAAIQLVSLKTEQNVLGGQVSLEGFKAHCRHCTGGKGVPVPDCPRVEGIPSNIC